MATDRFAARRDRLRRLVRNSDAEAVLVSNDTNVSYLTGFTGDSSYLLLGAEHCLLVSDTRYAVQIADECPSLDVFIRDSSKELVDAAAQAIGSAGLTKLGFESNATSFATWEELTGKVKPLELVPLKGLVEQLREVKDAEEIAEIRTAVRLAERGFTFMRAELTGSMTELDAAHDLEHAMRRFGSPGAAFAPIVAAGYRSALPHAHATRQAISAAAFLLVDWGADSPAGYKSDLTRVLATGKISPKLEKLYGVVSRAQQRAIAAIRPGAECKNVDALARRVIDKAGYSKNFGHGLGHGIGLDIHEGPRLSPIAQGELKRGMVVTVEPGVYLPGWGGIRIEDDVLVTRDGHEVLTSTPRNLDELMVELD